MGDGPVGIDLPLVQKTKIFRRKHKKLAKAARTYPEDPVINGGLDHECEENF